MITLKDVQAVTTDDVDFNLIDETRKSSFLLDNLPFSDTVAPGTGGSTLTAGYTRLTQERAADTRRENTEYPAREAKRDRVTVDLVPMGARYNIDRVYAGLGDPTTSEVVFQQGEARKATIAKFTDLFINGVAADFTEEVPEFDGLDALLTGTSTESFAPNGSPWAFGNIASQAEAVQADLAFRSWIRKFYRRPDALFVNQEGAAFLDRVNAWRSISTTTQDSFGQDIPTFGGIPYVDLGEKSGSSESIIATSGSGTTTIYGVCFGADSVHGYSVQGGRLLKSWLPKFGEDDGAGAVKPGEVELGPVAIAAKRTKGAGAFRVDVQ